MNVGTVTTCTIISVKEKKDAWMGREKQWMDGYGEGQQKARRGGCRSAPAGAPHPDAKPRERMEWRNWIMGDMSRSLCR
eukprot:5485795-Pyramimonas_sp.AAC.1